MKIFEILHKAPSTVLSMVHTFLIKRHDGVCIGTGTRIYYRSKIINRGCVLIGENCMIGRKKEGYHAGMPFYTTILNDCLNGVVKIGDNCRINGAYIHAKKETTIGDNCVIASGVNIIDSNGHQVNSLNRTIGRDEPKPIRIGNNVWIGLNAVILKGSEIGDNSVIGAGCVVKGIIPPNSIVQSPQNVVCELSDDKVYKVEVV